ncbi:MAG TPA: MarR family transcriptional regulator [Friedmanniella sp.]
MNGAPVPADDARSAAAVRLTPVLLRVGRRIRPASGDLAVGHFSTLSTLYRFGPQRPSDLARIERFAPPAVTRIVGALEDRGLVVRHPSPDDARSSLVEITEEGRRLLVATRTEQAQGVARLLAVLDDEELGAVTAALDALEKVAHEASAVLAESVD